MGDKIQSAGIELASLSELHLNIIDSWDNAEMQRVQYFLHRELSKWAREQLQDRYNDLMYIVASELSIELPPL